MSICSSIPLDPKSVAGVKLATEGSNTCWTVSNDGLLCLDGRIYILNHSNLCLQVLHNLHNHPLAGHFGMNHILVLIHWTYTWPKVSEWVSSYVSSCTSCGCNKPHRYWPYGCLKPLAVPICPWDSISMDFIEQLPGSNSYTVILVIVDWALKQGIFIPTTDNITSEQLTLLFIIHVFSKHGIPNHVTCDRGCR